jgi:Zn-dependent protease with chaperone function
MVGVLLSRLTLAAVERVQADGDPLEGGRAARIIRAIYRVVVIGTCLYFYISIPVVAITIPAIAGYLAFVLGNPLLILLAGPPFLLSMGVVVRSVLTWKKEGEPVVPVLRQDAPGLWSLVEEVAGRVNTRPVDAIYIVPTAGVSVTEVGSLVQKLRDAGQRHLFVGLGVLPRMTQAQFRAILAYEYGHFIGRETVAGSLLGHVHFLLHRIAYGLQVERLAHWYNPAWLFVNGFNRVFLRITLGASRLHEILADRYGALACGVQNSVDGLTHVVRRGLAFGIVIDDEIERGRWTNLRNIYRGTALYGPLIERLQVKLDQEMNRPTAAYDSHPAPKERIRRLQPLVPQIEMVTDETDQELVWDLLPDTEALGETMAEVMAGYVRQRIQHKHLRRQRVVQWINRRSGDPL